MTDTTTTGNYNGLADLSLWLGITGGAMQTVGAYYSVKAQQNQLKSQALNAEFAATQSSIEARAIERDAVEVQNASQKEQAIRGLVEAQEVGAQRTSAAASGVAVGVGNQADIERAMRVAAAVDKRRIRTAAEQQANRLRNAAVTTRANGLLGRASAANMRATARTMNPEIGALGAATGSAGSILSQYVAYQSRR